MTDFVTGVTFGGDVWTPSYVTDINQKTCIGCGRCFKVCPRDVFDLVDKYDVLDAADIDDEFEDEDDSSMVMSIKNALDCIGCEACSKVCPKDCFTHQHKAAA
ncbi:ferredoxin III, nif-specific [Methylocucumis oryzae]|uniref:Ferredoxin III n=1 Tax=Methylocucumis oryzae TaxID=1632867 RepID=A0A0F3ILI6_9GAMM|nr:ferredoxin III, nif-specific [Methylocucumis oryzae]KJV07571.1 ferredoxin [Methylocucumis oryzae]